VAGRREGDRSAVIHLGPPLPTASSGLPVSSGGPPSGTHATSAFRPGSSWPCSGWGLP